MQQNSLIRIDQLISAVNFIEKTAPDSLNTVISQRYLQPGEEDKREFNGGKQRVLARRTCPSASTSTFGCNNLRTSSTYSSILEDGGRPYSVVSSRHSRAIHNELEKTRRANLRGYLDKLKDIVPMGPDSTRNTTLLLLTRARDYIAELTKSEREFEAEKKRLKKRNDELRQRIENARRQKSQTLRPESTSTISVTDEENVVSCPASPNYLEYSPSTKHSPVYSYDLHNDGLVPVAPLLHPRPSVYPFFDVKTPPCNYVLLPIEIGL